MRRIVIGSLTVLLGLGTAVLVGCSEDGDLEKAGKEADKAVEDAGEAVEGAAEDAGKAIDDLGN